MAKIMNHNEMNTFILNIGRSELFQELRELRESGWYPRYLKAVRVSLIALGYDSLWVERPFRTALDRFYLHHLPLYIPIEEMVDWSFKNDRYLVDTK